MIKKVLFILILFFTAVSIPLAYKTHWAYNWQKERKQEKQKEIDERIEKLRMPLLDIDDISVLDVTDMSVEDFHKKWVYRPVRVKGVLDNSQEVFLQRPQSGEKGLQVITPLYTGVNEQGNLTGVFVDRGWLDQELADLRIHWQDGKKSVEAQIEGVVIYGEGKSHTGKNNDEINKIRIDLEEFMEKCDLVNKEQATRIMIKEGAESGRALKRATPADLCYWYVTPERHQAYSTFWMYATLLNGFANVIIWFYF